MSFLGTFQEGAHRRLEKGGQDKSIAKSARGEGAEASEVRRPKRDSPLTRTAAHMPHAPVETDEDDASPPRAPCNMYISAMAYNALTLTDGAIHITVLLFLVQLNFSAIS